MFQASFGVEVAVVVVVDVVAVIAVVAAAVVVVVVASAGTAADTAAGATDGSGRTAAFIRSATLPRYSSACEAK